MIQLKVTGRAMEPNYPFFLKIDLNVIYSLHFNFMTFIFYNIYNMKDWI